MDNREIRFMMYAGYFIMVILVLVMIGYIQSYEWKWCIMNARIKTLEERTKMLDRDYELDEIMSRQR